MVLAGTPYPENIQRETMAWLKSESDKIHRPMALCFHFWKYGQGIKKGQWATGPCIHCKIETSAHWPPNSEEETFSLCMLCHSYVDSTGMFFEPVSHNELLTEALRRNRLRFESTRGIDLGMDMMRTDPTLTVGEWRLARKLRSPKQRREAERLRVG